jgi:ribosomal protein S15P/S13E
MATTTATTTTSSPRHRMVRYYKEKEVSLVLQLLPHL